MKTLEELEQLTKPVLEGIITELGGTPKKNAKKGELVQLAYDMQQPDDAPSEDETTEEVSLDDNAPSGNEFSEEEVQIAHDAIEDFFDGELTATEDTDEKGATIYNVVDVVGDIVATGTFLNLYNDATDGEAALEGAEEVEAEPEPVEPPEVTSGDAKEVEKALKPLQTLGLRYEISGGAVSLTFGSKKITTTINQPLRRVVGTAQRLCGV